MKADRNFVLRLCFSICLSVNVEYKYKFRMQLVDRDATLTRDAVYIRRLNVLHC